jgi:CheY-like chemotaxis protein
MPDIDGWTILNILKTDPDLRHIPVDVITNDDEPIRGLSRGALQYLTKPITREQIECSLIYTRSFLDRSVKNLLVVTSDLEEQKQLSELLGAKDITIAQAARGKEALAEMKKRRFDCVVTGLQLADMRAEDFVSAIVETKSLSMVPVVIYLGAPLNNVERVALQKLSALGPVKEVDSLDRLYDQTALFLHRVVSTLPKEKLKLFQQLQQAKNILGGKKVLIVDDDARNIFALTSALELKGIVVSSAERGAIAIDLLKERPDIDMVLMDIMMPEMDGYETMSEIRKLAEFKKLPIIALTAKAMVGDREKCLEAGASDYLSKPVNIVQLSSLMQVWLTK